MIKKESIDAALNAYDIEAECIKEMKNYVNDDEFAKAVELLSNAVRIGAAGSGHSGIACQHFCHLITITSRPCSLIAISTCCFR